MCEEGWRLVVVDIVAVFLVSSGFLESFIV